jgi:hypothetical protein
VIGVGDELLPIAQRAVDAGAVPVRPRGFNEHAAKVCVARLGDGTAPSLAAARVLAWHRDAVAHQLCGALEARQLADLGDDRGGRQLRDATQCL